MQFHARPLQNKIPDCKGDKNINYMKINWKVVRNPHYLPLDTRPNILLQLCEKFFQRFHVQEPSKANKLEATLWIYIQSTAHFVGVWV